MRWCLTALLLCTSLACSPEREAKEQTKREVHTQPAIGGKTTPTQPEDPNSQSFYDGMLALCESYEKAPKSDEPAEGQKLLHAWIEKHVTNNKVREVFTLVGTMPPNQRSGMLRAAAAKVGITGCALAGPDPLDTVAPTTPM